MRWPTVLTVLTALAGCGDRAASGPFDGLPGDGAGDWIAGASRSPRYIPRAVDPTQGTLITANADPVGASSRWVFP